jgi:hypothetical protein
LGCFAHVDSVGLKGKKGLRQLDPLTYPGSKGIKIEGTRQTIHLLATAKKRQGRYRSYGIARRKPLLLLGINLNQAQVWLKLACGLGKYRRHHTTGPTPRCPKINQQWKIALLAMALKAHFIQGQGFSSKERPMTLAAPATIAQTIGRKTINPITMGTDYVNRFAHRNKWIQIDLYVLRQPQTWIELTRCVQLGHIIVATYMKIINEDLRHTGTTATLLHDTPLLGINIDTNLGKRYPLAIKQRPCAHAVGARG